MSCTCCRNLRDHGTQTGLTLFHNIAQRGLFTERARQALAKSMSDGKDVYFFLFLQLSLVSCAHNRFFKCTFVIVQTGGIYSLRNLLGNYEKLCTWKCNLLMLVAVCFICLYKHIFTLRWSTCSILNTS